MALQGPFFGKRDEPSNRTSNSPNLGGTSSLGSAGSGAQPFGASATSPVAPSVAPATAMPESKDAGAKLTVGANIKLKGVEITDCDTLVVEGTVEATMNSRVIQIAEQGAFNGSAEIDIAEVRGTFSGDLKVREKLVIFSTGKVTGKIRYGKIVVEEGGQLSGEITCASSESDDNKAKNGNKVNSAGAKT